jgi:transcription-repair coupling factor (superfamily II helicase)
MIQNQEQLSIGDVIDSIPERSCGIDFTGLYGSDKAYFVSRLYLQHKVPILAVVPSQKDADRFLEDLCFFLEKPTPPIFYFPPYNILPFKDLAYHNETAAKRIRALYQLTGSEVPPIVVTTAEALLNRLIPKHEIVNYAELVMEGEQIDRDHLIEKLISGGYTRSVIVEEPGDFCVRGGILDIYSPLYPDPLRIELFGDTVDSLRFFSAVTQRTKQRVQEAVVLPAREAILKMDSLDPFISRVRMQASTSDMPVTKVRELIHRIKTEGVFTGIESLIPLIYPELHTLFDYVPGNALHVLVEPGQIQETAEGTQEQALNSYTAACKQDRLCVEPHALNLYWSEAKEVLLQKKPLTLKALPMLKGGFQGPESIQVGFSVTENSAMTLELKRQREKSLMLPLVNWVNDKKQSGSVVFVCSSRIQADRLKSLLLPYGVQLKPVDGFHDVKHEKGLVYICTGRISSGFIWSAESIALITDNEIFGRKLRPKRVPEEKISPQTIVFEDLKKGDLVVHIEHGIGRYEGLVKLKLNGSNNDFLLINYKNSDKLYLPVDRMSMVQKYMGVDGMTPVLDRLGGKSWGRVKQRVKRSAEKIAGELLKLYAERKVKKGYAFEKPDSDALDFEAGFPYEETADQLKAINDVLQDLQKPTSMDRLVCGDVGYGKTEVALRASFLAVNNGKQVAVVVPTTVLAEQHYATFISRFEHYPVNIACLSRFRSSKEQRKIINALKTGRIDVVIGTHRLIQKDVFFKDLGLIVLDEEQRFGVKHKEKLKQIRSTVDVLALTATPIPRTLHMSLTGIRDISIISTPPEHRRSIITYISELDDAVISEAIRKELKRGGQIFFVHNSIHSIRPIARRLQELVPEVRLDVAHGRLNEKELETVMLRFMNHEIDLLVCTSIIESGLDVPAANTILVNRADCFGLAQMYQLRGRVGRTDEQAYAYLFIPNESTLTRDARKRLKVLMEHSDLGSGFQIAMSDLKIRGGGTILGASQSGHIAAVGYDMFLKLMENAISEMKGEPVCERLEPEINIDMSAYIPESYIPDIDQRLSAYRRLSRVNTLKEITEFKNELIDRFGILPVESSNLLLKIMLKVLSIEAGVRRLDLTGQQITLYFSKDHQKHPDRIVGMKASAGRHFELTPGHMLKARFLEQNTSSLLAQAKNILKEITHHVSS